MDIKERIIGLVESGRITPEEGEALLRAMGERREKPKSFLKKLFLSIGGGLLGIVGVVVIIGVIFGWLLAILWNATLVPLFHFPSIGFWMALKLAIFLALIGGLIGGGFKLQHKG